jgi:hypothetical protein
MIPRKPSIYRLGPVDRALSRLQKRVARLSNRRTPHRQLATRDEKCAAHSHAMWVIAATL